MRLCEGSWMRELTVVVEQQHEQLCPTTPFEPSFRLAKQFASVDQGPGIVKEVHILWSSLSQSP